MRVVCNNRKLRLRQSGRRVAWTSRLFLAVEEDYQVCARMLARGKDSEAGKTRKRRKE